MLNRTSMRIYTIQSHNFKILCKINAFLCKIFTCFKMHVFNLKQVKILHKNALILQFNFKIVGLYSLIVSPYGSPFIGKHFCLLD